MSDYNTFGFKYGSDTTPGSAGGVLTWAVDSTVPAYFTSVLTAAFADWSSHANVQFQEVNPTSSATIKFTLSAIDGLNNTLGEGGSSFYNSSTGLNKAFSGQVTFDSGEMPWPGQDARQVEDPEPREGHLQRHRGAHAPFRACRAR